MMEMLKSLLFLLMMFSMESAEGNSAGKCPYGWTNFGVKCYKFFSQETNWTTAERNCQSLNANLASVHSKAENDFLLSLVSDKLCWVGAHDGEEDGQWFWTDGSPSDFTNWCPEEPNNYGAPESCLMINFSSNICWNDGRCSSQLGYMCATGL